MIKRNVLCCALFSLMLQSCEAWTQEKFRFRGIYILKKSGYQVELIAQGIRDIGGAQSIADIHRLVQICPIRPNRGKPVRFRITTQQSNPVSVLVGEDSSIPAKDWDSRSFSPVGFGQVEVLRRILAQAGFNSSNYTDLMTTYRILESPPPIYPFTTGLTVKQSDLNDNYQFDRNQPQSMWINRTELLPCS